MTLWEREQMEMQSLEDERAARVVALDAQRQKEAAEARARQEAWRVEDEVRAAAEEEARQERLVEARKAQEVAASRGRAEVAKREQDMVVDQQRLAEETERVRQATEAREAALKLNRGDGDDFAYSFEEGMEKKVKAFRQRGTGGDALIIKWASTLSNTGWYLHCPPFRSSPPWHPPFALLHAPRCLSLSGSASSHACSPLTGLTCVQ